MVEMWKAPQEDTDRSSRRSDELAVRSEPLDQEPAGAAEPGSYQDVVDRIDVKLSDCRSAMADSDCLDSANEFVAMSMEPRNRSDSDEASG